MPRNAPILRNNLRNVFPNPSGPDAKVARYSVGTSFLPRMLIKNQLIGVLNQFTNEGSGHRPIQHHRVPMFFVHVPAGLDTRIAIPQFHRTRRIAFQIDPSREFRGHCGCKHFSTNFKDEYIWAERRGLFCFWQFQAQGNHFGQVHKIGVSVDFKNKREGSMVESVPNSLNDPS